MTSICLCLVNIVIFNIQYYYMNYISLLQDSIDTSVDMKLFKNRKDASLAHIFKSRLVKLPLSIFKDIRCVKFYQKQIQQDKDITPIWILKKNKRYILLDGAHRVVSSYIEGKHSIKAYVISV